MLVGPNCLGKLIVASMLIAAMAGVTSAAHATTMTIVNKDGPGEGFNDPTPAALVGGNPGITLGQQRLNAFQFVANLWAARVSSPVAITVAANFDALPCTSSFGTLGGAGASAEHRDFTGASRSSTWYPSALANALHGSQLVPGSNDIVATFNSMVGTPGCLDSLFWYYGLDGNPPAGGIDLASVVLHELGHGLGFATFVDTASGAKLLGFDDAFMLNLEDHRTGRLYPEMTNAERVAASIATGNLHWVGPNVRQASAELTSGTVGDHVRMYAPNPQQPGSSVSHWDTALTPNELMEPSYTGPIHAAGLEIPLLRDIGWVVNSGSNAMFDFNGDGKADILWRHSSGLVCIWLMNGASSIGQGCPGTVGLDWTIQNVGDFNGDGKTDILWRHSSGLVCVWLMNGASIASTGCPGSVAGEWSIQGVADFDHDGKADILWRHSSGLVCIWLMNGFSLSSSGCPGSAGLDWSIQGVADFDHDGRADILWRHSSGLVCIWLMNGAALSSSGCPGSAGLNWSIQGVGDFDGHGKADILWRDTSGNVCIWLLDGFRLANSGCPGAAGLDWTIQYAADFNGDGKADILWRHSSGLVCTWFMDGTNLSSSACPGSVGNDWKIE